jgi:hypothetical protein
LLVKVGELLAAVVGDDFQPNAPMGDGLIARIKVGVIVAG